MSESTQSQLSADLQQLQINITLLFIWKYDDQPVPLTCLAIYDFSLKGKKKHFGRTLLLASVAWGRLSSNWNSYNLRQNEYSHRKIQTHTTPLT